MNRSKSKHRQIRSSSKQPMMSADKMLIDSTSRTGSKSDAPVDHPASPPGSKSLRHRTSRTLLSTLLPTAGMAASAIGMLAVLGKDLSISAFALSIISTLVALAAGVYSMYIARFAKKLTSSPRVFISYSRADQTSAIEVARALRRHGARVWLDQERLRPGESIRDAMQQGIEEADTFVVLLSDQLQSNMLLELGLANSKGIRIIPVILRDTQIPNALKDLQYVDLRHEKRRGLEELAYAAT